MLSGLILSGGHSSRMGRDKALVELGGRPLICYVADVVSSVADEVVVSVARRRTEAYSAALEGDFRFVEDDRDDIGPLEGLVRGLRTARGEYVLVSPCDTPFLRRQVCGAIAAAAVGRDGAVPKTGKDHIEPLHGTYRRERCAEVFERVLAAGEYAPPRAYASLDMAYVEESALRALDPDLISFRNINSSDALGAAEAQLARLL